MMLSLLCLIAFAPAYAGIAERNTTPLAHGAIEEVSGCRSIPHCAACASDRRYCTACDEPYNLDPQGKACVPLPSPPSPPSPSSPPSSSSSTTPVVQYRHNYNNNGTSAWALCNFSHFVSQVFIPGASPFFVDSTTNTSLGSNTTVAAQKLIWLDPAYSLSWHEEPAKQLLVFISGHGEWTNEDGVPQSFRAGDMYVP